MSRKGPLQTLKQVDFSGVCRCFSTRGASGGGEPRETINGGKLGLDEGTWYAVWVCADGFVCVSVMVLMIVPGLGSALCLPRTAEGGRAAGVTMAFLWRG